MYLNDEIYQIILKLINNFKKETLSEDDKKYVYVKEEICKSGKNPWGENCYFVGEHRLYFSNEGKCNLDKSSIHLANIHNKHTIKCHVLYLKLNTEISKEYRLDNNAFYTYNPGWLIPDSIVSLKLIEVIDSKPKDKGYRIVE